jgi:hypothetical protein
MATEERERRPDLREKVEEKERELRESEQNALEALKSASDSERETHTVELTGGIEVEVVDSLPGDIERDVAKIEKKVKEGDIDAAVDAMIRVMTHVIQTDGFDSREVWREYFEEYGQNNLLKCAMAATGPYYEIQRELENQRQFRGE